MLLCHMLAEVTSSHVTVSHKTCAFCKLTLTTTLQLFCQHACLTALILHCFGSLPHIRLLLKGWLSLQAEYCQPSQLAHLQRLRMGVQAFHLADEAPVQDQLFKTVVQFVESSSPEL